MASFPSSFDPERSCRICLYVGKTRSQLSNHDKYWHEDVRFLNKDEFSAYHRRPSGDTPRCEHCGIFIFLTEHKSNVLHLFNVAKAQNHQQKIVHTEPEPLVEVFRCLPRNGVSFRSEMVFLNKRRDIEPVPTGVTVYGFRRRNLYDQSEWIELTVAEEIGKCFLPLHLMARCYFLGCLSKKIQRVCFHLLLGVLMKARHLYQYGFESLRRLIMLTL